MPRNYRLMLLKSESLLVIAGIYEKNGDKEQMMRYLSKTNELADPHINHSVFFYGIVFEKKNAIHNMDGSY